MKIKSEPVQWEDKVERDGNVSSTIRTFYPRKDTSPVRSIRLFCLECMGMSRAEKNPAKPFEDVKECLDLVCPLYEFRFGKNPYLKRTLSPEQRKLASIRFKTNVKSVKGADN